MGIDTQLVVFSIKNELYGVPITQVKEIIRMETISKLPEMPQYIPGIINVRGKVHVIYDLTAKFGLGDQILNEDTKIIIINDKSVGFIVDKVDEIVQIEEGMQAAADLPISLKGNYISNIVKHNDKIIIVISLTDVFSQAKNTIQE